MAEQLVERLQGLPYPEARNQVCHILREYGFGNYFFSGEFLSDDEKRNLDLTSRILKSIGDPDTQIDADTWLRLAWVSFNLGNFDTSLEELERAIEKTPQNDDIHGVALNCKVLVCLKLERFAEAQGALDDYFALMETKQAGT